MECPKWSHEKGKYIFAQSSMKEIVTKISRVEFKKEAIDETIKYFTSSQYKQDWANKTLAKLLEITREKSNANRQTDYSFVKQVVGLFPE